MRNCSGSACPPNSSEEELPRGLEAHGNLELAFTVLSAVMVALLMFSLGCSVEIQKLWSHVRRPWGIAVGLLCQFGLMPLAAYLLAVSFSLKPAQAIVVLIMGCCPGGTVSNIFTFWADGDMDLSISMTTCSTVAALGMMPLCLYLYTWSWSLEQSLSIPYQNIGITLACLTIPVAFGVYVNYKWSKQSQIILKLGAIIGGVLLLVVAVAGVVLAKDYWNSDTALLTIGFIFPLIGHIMGFLLALLTHQSWQSSYQVSLNECVHAHSGATEEARCDVFSSESPRLAVLSSLCSPGLPTAPEEPAGHHCGVESPEFLLDRYKRFEVLFIDPFHKATKRNPDTQCRTISLETGAQNIQMCITMLQLSFTAEYLAQMFSFPLAYGLFQLLDGILIVAAYQTYKRLKNRHRRTNPDCVEVCRKESSSPKETGAFLEVTEEAAVTPGPSDLMECHRALEPAGHITSCG
ncbi:Solute carrier family 10 member 6 [Tupaia chinensis]|uniref:Solute carrier family 10 member 6 n=1 Tax=Tupaia chinensis TaxID=246437 RepID=L9L4U9_TUPCH|nr:Solute carrier family 10 member 6 [Tupaia chinensis]